MIWWSGAVLKMLRGRFRGKNIRQLAGRIAADFYKYGFVGIMLDWIKQGMRSDYEKIVERMCLTLHGTILRSIENFSEKHLTDN